MRILQVIQNTQLRGAEIFTSQLSNHLIAKGNFVSIVSLFKEDGNFPIFDDIKSLNANLNFRFFDFKAWLFLSKLIHLEKPDLVQANSGDTLKYAIYSKILFRWNQPIIFRNANKMSDFIDSFFKFHFNKWLLNQASHIISVSEECRIDLITKFKIDPLKVSTVTIGIETPLIDTLSKDIEWIFKRGPILLNVASFVPEKNHFGLLSIFAELRLIIPNCQLILIGKGNLHYQIKNKIHDLKLEDCVHLLGSREDVYSIMNKSSVLLLPSLIEGLPAVILEAMYAGLPVVSFNVGGISEVIKDKFSGILLEKGDSNGFIDAVSDLLQNDVLRRTIVNNARDMVISKFQNRHIASQFEYVYENILKN